MWEKNQITVLLIPAARARVGGRKALPQSEQGVRQLLEQTFKPQLHPASVSSWGNCTRRQFGSRCTCGWALTQEREKKKAVGCYRFIKISRTLHLLQASGKPAHDFSRLLPAGSSTDSQHLVRRNEGISCARGAQQGEGPCAASPPEQRISVPLSASP